MTTTDEFGGFDSARQLIGYCELHCETQRALFSCQQINAMLRLAGHPEGWVSQVGPDEWFSLHEHMAELCVLARQRTGTRLFYKQPIKVEN